MSICCRSKKTPKDKITSPLYYRNSYKTKDKMTNLETEIIINASPKSVWKVLMDFEEYPNWNPFIKKISGSATVLQVLEVELQLKGKKALNIQPKVIKNINEKVFSWRGHLFIEGLFDGEHYFQIEKYGENQSKFIHGENFSGLMSVPILKIIGKNTLKGFISMNEALKKQTESLSPIKIN